MSRTIFIVYTLLLLGLTFSVPILSLPPLSGSIGGSNVRNTLAPLKKSPSNSANKPLEANNTSKEKKSSGIHGTHEYIIFA